MINIADIICEFKAQKILNFSQPKGDQTNNDTFSNRRIKPTMRFFSINRSYNAIKHLLVIRIKNDSLFTKL